MWRHTHEQSHVEVVPLLQKLFFVLFDDRLHLHNIATWLNTPRPVKLWKKVMLQGNVSSCTYCVFNLLRCYDHANSTCFFKLFLVDGVLWMILHKVQCSCGRRNSSFSSPAHKPNLMQSVQIIRLSLIQSAFSFVLNASSWTPNPDSLRICIKCVHCIEVWCMPDRCWHTAKFKCLTCCHKQFNGLPHLNESVYARHCILCVSECKAMNSQNCFLLLGTSLENDLLQYVMLCVSCMPSLSSVKLQHDKNVRNYLPAAALCRFCSELYCPTGVAGVWCL